MSGVQRVELMPHITTEKLSGLHNHTANAFLHAMINTYETGMDTNKTLNIMFSVHYH
jgi:hypothetical protein